MPFYPDIKDTGALVEFIRWGTPHHGLLDGATLDDGDTGVSHPHVYGYWQDDYLSIVPCFALTVPGHTPPTLPVPSPGNHWLGYGLFTGTRHAFYRKTLLPVPQYGAWALSFGVGDTWRAVIGSTAVVPNSGGGTCGVTVYLTRFGQMQQPDDATLEIILPSNTLSPCGQPLFSGGADDFASTALYLRPLDFSRDGTKVLLGVMPEIEGYNGFGAPRGVLLLEITRSAATLSLFKSRSDMLVSATVAIGSMRTWNTSRTLGAYFDDTDTPRPLIETVASVYSSVSDSITNDGTNFTRDTTARLTQAVTISNGVGTVVEAAFQQDQTANTTGTKRVTNDWEINTAYTLDWTHTQISGRLYEATSTTNHGPEIFSTPDHIAVFGAPTFAYEPFLSMWSALDGSYTRPPTEFRSGTFTICEVSYGALCHRSPVSGEYSLFHCRAGVGGYVPYVVGQNQAMACVHPVTGETAAKRGTWSLGSEPSFGWV